MYPERFAISIKNKAEGRLILNLLHTTSNIRVHNRNRSVQESLAEFERRFTDSHKVYRISYGMLSGSGTGTYKHTHTAQDIIGMQNNLTKLLWL
jgi:thiamine phosphate synthase YjbQ (UPF0047 family)